MRLIDAAIKDLEMIGDCRTCGNKTPFCDSNPDSCSGYKWRGVPPHMQETDGPLTLEELRKMDGEPVWIVSCPLEEWNIIHSCHPNDVVGGGVIMTRRTAEKRTYPYADYGKTWQAYRRKPEEGENATA